ncbi:sigma-70 family RNA polymerase sigma factor [Intrasporangium sp. DVR]|uniref:RNA polymerase sigma factor n=1 Tax=Intrasporangium sp. DVR TaxID=3127867 RepID=UPI00313A69DE
MTRATSADDPSPASEGPARLAPVLTGPAPSGREVERDWVDALRSSGPERDAALRDLHALLVAAARHQVGRMRGQLPHLGARSLEDLAQGAADDALTTLLAKLGTFEGRSRFTTWAYKFAIFQTANEVRRHAWSAREVELRDDDVTTPGPEEIAEATDLAEAVRAAMQVALTGYQRRIAVALLVDGVPIDVLAQRLGTTRGALYKTLHVARTRLRAHLVTSGRLQPEAATGGPS